MKKLIAAILAVLALTALASCSLFRKASDTPGTAAPETTAETVPDDSYATDFSEPDREPDVKTVRYTEDQAYEALTHSFPEVDIKKAKIERTGAIVAENNGTEYYIFKVALPKKAETTKDGETKETELEDPVNYYVSVNGVVHSTIVDNNVDTKYAEAKFTTKYTDTDSKTGFAYKLDYEGLLQTKDYLCYSFAVYLVDTSGESAKNVYQFNYLVTVDGGYNAETVIAH